MPSSRASSILSSPPASRHPSSPLPTSPQDEDQDLSEDEDMASHVSGSEIADTIKAKKGIKRPIIDASSDNDWSYGVEGRSKSRKKKKKVGAKSKVKGKVKVKEKKDQGKLKAAEDHEDRDDNEGVEEEGAGKKKAVLRAKVRVWKDLPDWKGRTDCPLLTLPREILDMCFNLKQSLALRDYISLAGVSRFFRHQLDNDFFEDLYYEHVSPKSRPEKKWIFDPETKKGGYVDIPDKGHPGLLPFSRDIVDWRGSDKKAESRAPYSGHGKHYVPRRERSSWSREQYVVYKEEKDIYLTDERKKKKEEAKKQAEKTARRRGRETVKLGINHRTILAEVPGRKDGEAAVEKDDHGLPIKVEASEGVDDEPDGEPTAPKWRTNLDDMSPDDDWEVPESVFEDETAEIRYDKYGSVVRPIYWESDYRRQTVEYIKDQNVNLKTAQDEYKVTKAELIALKHFLVPNPSNTKTPQHVWNAAAVEALAFRAHGGPTAHKQYVEDCITKSTATRKLRLEREEEAKKKAIADGTYVVKYRKHHIPPWNKYYERYIRRDCDDEECECNDPSRTVRTYPEYWSALGGW